VSAPDGPAGRRGNPAGARTPTHSAARTARPRAPGRFQEVNGFIDYTMRFLTPAAREVWFILWRDTKSNGLARTGQADIARRAGVSERAVRSALTELKAAGVVRVVRQGRLGAGASTYRVRGVNPAGVK